jgi:hypothetical protein
MPGAVVGDGLPIWQADLVVDDRSAPRVEVFSCDRAEADAVALSATESAHLGLRGKEVGDRP